jgi:hypothetical protein
MVFHTEEPMKDPAVESLAADFHRMLRDAHIVCAWFNWRRSGTVFDFDVAVHIGMAIYDHHAAVKHARRAAACFASSASSPSS